VRFPIYEAIMLICFGAAWPFSIAKAWRSRSSNGKSVLFLLIIWTGYIAGILNKVTSDLCRDPVLILYALNTLMVSADIALFFRNRRLENKHGH